MKIKAKTKFLHGRAKLEQGKSYDVPEGLGTYFVMMGWAEEAKDAKDAEAISADTFLTDAPPARKGDDLEVQNATLGQKTQVKGGNNG